MAELPPRPVRPPAPASPSKPERGSWFSIFLTLLLIGVLGAVFFVLSLGQLLPVLAIGGLVFLVTAFHYVVWGWWLGKIIHREAQEEEPVSR